jgi:glycogen synthase
VFPCRLEWMDDPWDDVRRSGEWLLDVASRWGADVVHLNGYAHAALDWPVPTVVAAHSCVCSWWRAVHGVPAPDGWNAYRTHVRRGLRRATAIVAPSAVMRSALASEHGAFGVRVIPNGRAMTEEAGASPASKEPIVLAAGRLWDPAKNIAALSAAAARLPWPVCVAGDASIAGEAAIQPLDNVRSLGGLSAADMASWMRRAAIYALPARYEPFGLSILEAGACGCALVLGDTHSLRENWDGAATFVPPSDVEALRDAVLRLITEDSLRADMARRAHQRSQLFPIERTAAAYDALYAQAAAKPRRAAAVLRPAIGTAVPHAGVTRV